MALKKWFPVFVLPTLAAFTIVFAVPFILGLGLSFTEFTTVLDAKWVAFENYIKAFSNRDFLNALWFTVKFAVVSVMMIIYIAGIQNIPSELQDASKVDGASRWQTLRHVTIPLVMPSVTICLFLTITNSFKLFDQNLALTAGAPSKQTAMLALDIYNTFYGKIGREGVGQAKAVIFFIIVAAISFAQLIFTRKKEVEQ